MMESLQKIRLPFARFVIVGVPLLLLFGCVTPIPEPVEETPAPVIEPETPSLEKLADILNEQGFVTAESDRGLVVYLPSLYFAVDSAGLSIQAQARIQSISEVMNRKDFSDHKIAVEGHTDSLGNAENNMALSRQRAESVADHLVFSNISTDRVEVAWFGETAPRAPNRNTNGSDNPENRAKNRRVEFIISTPGT